MSEEGGGSKFPQEESDTAARRTILDELIALRQDFVEFARDLKSIDRKVDVLSTEAGRTNSFLTAHALRLDSIGPPEKLNGLAGKTVLVVDDELALLRSLKISLTRRGAIVLDASSVSLAVDFVRTARIDVALVDLRIPHTEDGLDLARWICRARPSTAVVVTSGLLDAPGLDALPVARIPKPFGLDDLERVLCEAMGHGTPSLHPDELPSTVPPPAPTGFEEAPLQQPTFVDREAVTQPGSKLAETTPPPTTADESPQAKREG